MKVLTKTFYKRAANLTRKVLNTIRRIKRQDDDFNNPIPHILKYIYSKTALYKLFILPHRIFDIESEFFSFY